MLFDKSTIDMSLPVTLLFTSLNALIFVALSAYVVRRRFTERVSLGTGGKKPLEVAIRTHGNFAEYVPFALLLIALLEAGNQPKAFLYGLGALLTLSRLSHVIGLQIRRAPNPFRMFGLLGTWLVLIAGALAGLIASFA